MLRFTAEQEDKEAREERPEQVDKVCKPDKADQAGMTGRPPVEEVQAHYMSEDWLDKTMLPLLLFSFLGPQEVS